MATFVQTGSRLYVGGYNWSANTSAIALAYGAEAKDDTTFGGTTRTSAGGLKTVELGYAGLMNPAQTAKHKARFDSIGVNDSPVTVVPEANTIGNRSFFFQSLQASFAPKMELGEMYGFDVSAMGRGDLIQANMLYPLTTTTTTAASTAQELGAVSATQSAYACLHVVTFSGTSPTLDVIVESDTAVGFPSTTTRFTFTQATGYTSQIMSLGPAAITDTWWRITHTIGGTDTPTFAFLVSLGIQ